MSIDAEFFPMFSVPMGFVNFGEGHRNLNSELILDMENEMSKTDGKKRSFSENKKSWQSVNGMEYQYQSFINLRKQIHLSVVSILKKTGVTNGYEDCVDTGNLWGNIIHDIGGWAQPHYHGTGNTLWSGVYYPKGIYEIEDLDILNEEETFYIGTPKTDHGGVLTMQDPAGTIKSMLRCGNTKNEYYGSPISVIPRESLLILFPAYVSHYVTPVITKDKRYSISFSVNKPNTR